MSGAAGGGAGAGAVVRQGHLRKLKTMKKKFFVLRAETADCSARLEYYESEKKFRAGAAPRRVLPLKSCYNIMRRLDLKQKHVIALFTREEQFCIVAENEQELHAWLTAILKQHRSDDASEELLHPIQHVWQVNVQKKGLGATKTIQGLYNLCLTDKTLALVKIKSHNNVISDLGIPERVEYSLKNIRRCGDSECFFYMEVGRQTTTGAGELWMHTDDSNIAQSMHSTIYHAMRNCAKENEHERDHIVLPKGTPEGNNTFRPRGWSYNGSDKAGSANDKGLCVGSCIKQCVCSSASYSIEDSVAAVAPLAANADNQSNTLTDKKENPARLTKHNRTGSLPAGCALFQEPLKIVHTRTKSAPLTGDELDRMVVEKPVMHSSCKAINGTDMSSAKKTQWARRASTGTRLFKLSPAHSKNVASTLRGRSDTMPSRIPSFEVERPLPRYPDLEGGEASRDEPDAAGEWHRTPRIPEEPDCVDMSRDFITARLAGPGSVQHSRTSSVGEAGGADVPEGYLPMAPAHDALGGLISASSGSVCSGTPSTDPRFSEYQLDPATSHIGMESRPPRANSVGSRPSGSGGGGGAGGGGAAGGEGRHRAYSVGARVRPHRHHAAAPPLPLHHAHAHAHSRHSTEDHMEIDFSNNSPANRVSISQTPPITSFAEPRARANTDEYVDMSPRNAGYVEMKPGEPAPPRTPPVAGGAADGYVPMYYGRPATRPIAIAAARPPPPAAGSPDERRAEGRTPHGSQTLFPFSPDSPAEPAEPAEPAAEDAHQPLSTVREISEDGRRSPDVASSPQYVVLAREPGAELSCNPTATKTLARLPEPADARADATATATLVLAGGGAAARFSLAEAPRSPPPPSPGATAGPLPLNYAALDLEPRRAAAAPAQRAYTQIDFIRSEKLHAADAT